jgi:predicted DNA-binding transcriptional regulator YafY
MVTNAAWLTSLVMASAGDIEVLSPPELRNQVVAKAMKWKQS